MAAAELFWADEQSTEQQIEAVGALAAHMKFRAKSVVGLPIEKKAKYLATLPNVSETVAARALVNYHLERQRPRDVHESVAQRYTGFVHASLRERRSARGVATL